jgi:predicted nucleotidyltransferase
MRFGLNDEQISFLNHKLIFPLQKLGFKVWIFGSRVKNKNHPFSDIDLLLDLPDDSKNYSELKFRVSEILENFQNSNFPFKVDLVYKNNLAESYQESIENEKIKWPYAIT